MFEVDDTIQSRSQNQQAASLALYETSLSPRASHPIDAWPRQPAYFEPPPTSGSMQALRVPMDRNHLEAETQSHLNFSSAGDVCPWRLLPQAELGPERLVCVFGCGARQKIDPVVAVGKWRRLDEEKMCADVPDVVYTQCGRPRHLCLISDERVQVRCRQKHRTFRLGKPVAAAVEARVVYFRAILGCPDQWLDPLAWREDLENHWLAQG